MRIRHLETILGKIACLLAAAALGGCGHSGPERFEVQGLVNYAGKPVEVGTIALVPIDDTAGPLCGGNLAGGKFHIPREGGPVAGRYRVELSALEKTGRQRTNMGGEPFDERINVLPPKYHGPKSELTLEIPAAQPNLLVFDLKP